ncbi:MAG: peptidase MA family metallohydrolase [Thermomicrobiales bacterium]
MMSQESGVRSREKGALAAMSLLRLVVLLGLLLGLAPAGIIAAQEQQQQQQEAAPAVIPGLSVAENGATVDFPEGITFSLTAEADDPIAAVELLYRSPGVDTFSVELPPIDPGTTSLDISELVDLRAGELPPGVDVNYHWRIVEEDGDVVETPEQTLLWGDDRYQWTPLEGPNVTVYTYTGGPDFEQEILDAAERTVTSLSQSYDVTPDQRIRIWAYASRDDLYGALAPNSEPWIAGAAYPGLHIIMAILPPGDHSEVARVVPHEISHQVLHQATENPFNAPPQWLDEGLATYWQESGRERFYAYALQLAATGNVPSLRTLNGQFPYDRDGAMASYAFSLSAVMYIIDTWGDEGMSRLIATFPEGVSYDDAIQQGLGISFDELDRRWRDDLVADAKAAGVTGSPWFGDDGAGGAPGGSALDGILALTSGTLILGIVVLIALIAGLISLVRGRRHRDEDDSDLESGVRWREWPEGLEPPRHAHSPGQP